jgi:hypothetical protein
MYKNHSSRIIITFLYRTLALFAFLTFYNNCRSENPFTIFISNQQQFDSINVKLSEAISNKETNIQVRIGQGIYYFKENHIRRVKDHHPNVSVLIQGENAILIAAGTDYRNNNKYQGDFSPNATFVDTQDLSSYDYWGDCGYADGLIQVVDAKKNLCRLPYSKAKDMNARECENLYIRIPQWYKSSTYKVIKIEKGGIYFTADKLEYIQKRGRQEYTVNYDYLFAGKNTRFLLCNPTDQSKPMRIEGSKAICKNNQIHECGNCLFLSLNNVSYKNFTISGFHFIGNRDKNNHLISFVRTKTEKTEISNCRFEKIQSRIIFADDTPNFNFKGNTINHCRHHGLESTNSCENTIVTDNTFSNCGSNMLQTFCVNCKGKNYYIAKNKFLNFGYGAIGIGVWHGSKKGYESSGIVEYNEIWYDSEYLAHLERHTLMDSGAIYLWTQNDNAIVQYNYIHDYSGMYYNHGIYCDDGASHYKLYGNIIINIQSNNSIDARTCQSEFPESNQDIQMMYNIVDRPIKFEGNTKSDNGCIKSRNILLYKIGEDIPKHIYAHLKTKKQDKQLLYEDWDEQGIIVSNKTMKTLKQLPCFDQIKQYIKKK